ncbi:MAG: VWA domain-containing protein [Defluviitaleaceae bacterium]|nr:VWA domain-containing protein [Defluviitaleaceae bacterium]
MSKPCGQIKNFIIWLTVLALAVIFSAVVFAQAYPEDDVLTVLLPPIDVVLLIDVSGSMRFTDPNRAALSGAGDFIEMLTIGQSRVGVVGFSGQIQYYLPFRLLEDEYAVAELREEITQFQYVGFTDIGAALLAAAETMYTAENLQNPMILLMSDGWIQISPHVARRAEDSFADVEIALDILERNIPVYTVGLQNPHGGVDEALLEMIAVRSNAHAQFTQDADELPSIFISILEAHAATIPEPEPEIDEPEAIEIEEVPEYEEAYAYVLYEAYEYEMLDEYEPLEDYEPIQERSNVLYVVAIFTGLLAAISTTRLIRAVIMK